MMDFVVEGTVGEHMRTRVSDPSHLDKASVGNVFEAGKFSTARAPATTARGSSPMGYGPWKLGALHHDTQCCQKLVVVIGLTALIVLVHGIGKVGQPCRSGSSPQTDGFMTCDNSPVVPFSPRNSMCRAHGNIILGKAMSHGLCLLLFWAVCDRGCCFMCMSKPSLGAFLSHP